MGTDSAQIMRQDLGSGRPMLHYQEIPVFVSDFVSGVEPIHQLNDQTSLQISAIDTVAKTLTLSADAESEIETNHPGGNITASNPAYLVVRSGKDARFRKFVFKIVDLTAAVATYDPNHKILDDERNKLQSLAGLSSLDSSTGLIGREAKMFERVDGSSIYAGKFGEQEGLCGFTMMQNAGIMVQYVGPSRQRDEQQYRMKWYVS